MSEDIQRQVTEGIREALAGQKSSASWPQIFGAVITAATIVTAVASLMFVTEDEFSIHETLPSHPVGSLQIRNLEEGMKNNTAEIRKTSLNVILIGEKLQVKGLAPQGD